jgi:hypothetical protein
MTILLVAFDIMNRKLSSVFLYRLIDLDLNIFHIEIRIEPYNKNLLTITGDAL